MNFVMCDLQWFQVYDVRAFFRTECKTTWEMMERANIPYKYRDYCVDHYMEYQQCRQKYWPFFVMCKPVKHKYEDREFEE